MDAETEKPFDVDGKAVTAETSFTPEEANGSVELSFTFDASALSGKTLVAFETMTFEDHEVAVHADIKDANQTIYFPEIKTTAKDGSDGDQDVSASKEATIVDTVTYHGLMPGSEYKVIGTLMNKETGEALLKQKKLAALWKLPLPSTLLLLPDRMWLSLKSSTIQTEKPSMRLLPMRI